MTTNRKTQAFIRQRRGVYATDDYRFVLEYISSLHTWRICERGQLIGYKPTASRAVRAESPIWYRSNSARAAVAWAKHRLVGFALHDRSAARPQ